MPARSHAPPKFPSRRSTVSLSTSSTSGASSKQSPPCPALRAGAARRFPEAAARRARGVDPGAPAQRGACSALSDSGPLQTTRWTTEGPFVSVLGPHGGLERMKAAAQRATEDLLLLAAASERAHRDPSAPARWRICARRADPLACTWRRFAAPKTQARRAGTCPPSPDRGCDLILPYAPDDVATLQGHNVGVVTGQHSIVGTLRDMVKARWDRSVPLKVCRRDLHVARRRVAARLHGSRRQGCEAVPRAIRPRLHGYLRMLEGTARRRATSSRAARSDGGTPPRARQTLPPSGITPLRCGVPAAHRR